MVYCCVPYCTSSSRKGYMKATGISFHQFSCDEVMKNKWLKYIRRADAQGQYWQPADTSVVCSRHFKESDYKEGCKIKVLKVDSVPTIFEDYPKHLQLRMPKETVPRRTIKRHKPNVDKSSVNSNQLNVLVKASSIISTQVEYQKHVDEENVADVTDNTSTASENSTPTASENSTLIASENSTPIVSEIGVQTFDTTIRNCSSTQTNLAFRKLCLLPRKLKTTQRSLQRCKAKLDQAQQQNKILKNKMAQMEKTMEKHNVTKIVTDASENSLKAIFLREQLLTYGKRRKQWNEAILKYCVLCHSQTPKAYRYLRRLSMFSLPSPSTLKRYIGNVYSDQSLPSLIRQRLLQESKRLQPLEKMGSLIVDEMSIRPSLEYFKSINELVGTVNTGGLEKELGIENKLANRLFSFIFVGLMSNYRLPVSCFFTKQLKRCDLHKITLVVKKELEEVGFQVVRLVTDNNKVNVTLLNLMPSDSQP